MKEGIVPSISGRDVSYTVIEHYNIELKWFNKLKGGGRNQSAFVRNFN